MKIFVLGSGTDLAINEKGLWKVIYICKVHKNVVMDILFPSFFFLCV